jgi:hypothetical protein
MKKPWLWLVLTMAALAAVVFFYVARGDAGVAVTYSTGQAPASGATSVTGTENSAITYVAANGSVQKLLLVAVQNYGASAEVAMLFDSATLPANGAIPLASCALAAGTANAPAQCSLSLPADGRVMKLGTVVACSTTGKTLTVDATAGGVCYFQVMGQ